MRDDRRCTATAHRSGQRCKLAAILGGTVCGKHGGGASQVRAAANRRLTKAKAESQVAALGLPVDIEPQRALLDEVHRAAGAVAWIESVLHGFTIEIGDTPAIPDGFMTWAALYGAERDRLTRAAKLAIDAGVSERLVTIEEEKGALIAQLLTRIIDDPDLDLDDTQRTAMRSTAARHLRAVPTG